MAEKRVYTAKEVQEMLGISRAATYSLIHSGEFKFIVAGGRYLVSKESFDNWLNNSEPALARERKA